MGLRPTHRDENRFYAYDRVGDFRRSVSENSSWGCHLNHVGCFEGVCFSCAAMERGDPRLSREQGERNRVACLPLLDVAAIFFSESFITHPIHFQNVMSEAHQRPLGLYFDQPSEREPSETASLFDLPEHRLHDRHQKHQIPNKRLIVSSKPFKNDNGKTQNLPRATSCRFESDLGHHLCSLSF